MTGILFKMTYCMAIVSPEELAKYIVTAVFTIINLLVTYYILKRFLFKPAIKFMNKRRDSVASDIKEAKDMRKQALTMLSEGKQKIETATHEATAIVDDAKIQAEKQSGEILEKARREAVEIISRGHNDIERMKKAAIEDMRDEVADLSLAIAYKVVSQTLDENRQKELVDHFIEEEFTKKNDNDRKEDEDAR